MMEAINVSLLHQAILMAYHVETLCYMDHDSNFSLLELHVTGWCASEKVSRYGIPGSNDERE